MPRTLTLELEAEKNRTDAEWFLTATFDFAAKYGGTVRIDELGKTVGANAHTPIVKEWGEIASKFRIGAQSLDVFETTLQLVNKRVLNANTQRFSDFLTGNVEGTKVTIEIHFVDAAAALHTATLWVGSLDSFEWDFSRAAVKLSSRWRSKLEKDVLRVVDGEMFTHARPSDIGQTIPMVIGNPPKIPMRVTKGRIAGEVVPDEGNTGTAELSDIEVALDYAPTGDTDTITIVFTSTTAFNVTSADLGAQGSGTINGDFVSTDALLVIRSSAWTGAPASGDRFEVPLDVTDCIAVASESPVADSVVSLGQLYGNGFRLSDEDIETEVDTDAFDAILDDGADTGGSDAFSPGHGGAPDDTLVFGTQNASEAVSIMQPFLVPSQLTDPEIIGIRVAASGAAGEPTSMVIAILTDLVFPGASGIPDPTTSVVHRTVIDTDIQATGAFVETSNARVVAGRKYFLGIGATDTSNLNYYEANLFTVGSSDPNLDFAAFKFAFGSGTPTLLTGLQLDFTIYFRGRDGEIAVVGGEARGTYYTSWDQPDARLFKSIELGLAIDGSPTGTVAVELLRGHGLTPVNAEILAAIDMPLTGATGTYARLEHELAEILFAPPGRYFLRVTAEDETTVDDDGNEVVNRIRIKGGVASAADIEPDPTRDNSLRFQQYGMYPAPGSVWKTGYQAYEFDDGRPLSLDFAVRCVSFTKNVGATDAEGERVAQVSFDVPELPEDVAFAVDVRGINRRRPDDTAHFVINRAGFDDAEIDLAGTFAAAATLYGSVYRFDTAVIEQTNYAALLLKLAKESRSAFAWPIDKAVWKFLPDPTATADVVVDDDKIVTDRDDAGRITKIYAKVGKIGLDQVVNKIDLLYQRDFTLPRDKKAYRRTARAKLQSSIDDLDELEKPELWWMDSIRLPTMAQRVATFWATFNGEAKQTLETTLKLDYFEVSKFDVIELALLDDVGTEEGTGFGEGGFGEGGFGGGQAQISGTRMWLVEGIGFTGQMGRVEIEGRGF